MLRTRENQAGAHEALAPQELTRLFLLIHPLNAPFGKEIVWSEYTTTARSEFFFNAIRLFMPSSPSEALAIIPPIKPKASAFKGNIRDTITQMQMYRDRYSWISLHDAFQQLIRTRKNFLLGPDIPEPNVYASDFEKHLEERGFSIGPNTNIIIGGELTENCIADTARDFLRTLPQVSRVFLDTRLCLGIAEYAEHGKIPMETKDVLKERLSRFALQTQEVGETFLMISEV